MVTVVSSSSNVASVPLKSKRCVSSRTAWSTALVNSWVSISETTSNEGISGLFLSGFRQQLIEGAFELSHELRVVLAGGGSGIPSVNLAYLTLAVDENRRRKGIDLVQHRQLLGGLVLVRNTGNQSGVLDAVVLPETLRSRGGALEVAEVLEHQRDDLETLRAIVAIERCEERRFIVAIGAPAAGQRDDDDFVLEFG